MKSITIHGIDPVLDRKIAQKSAETGLSQNKTVKLILRDSLLKDKKESRIEAFRELFGTWTEDDARNFEEATKDLSQTDPGDWE